MGKKQSKIADTGELDPNERQYVLNGLLQRSTLASSFDCLFLNSYERSDASISNFAFRYHVNMLILGASGASALTGAPNRPILSDRFRFYFHAPFLGLECS